MKTVKMVIFDDAEKCSENFPAGWQQTLLGEIVTEQELLSVYHGLPEIATRCRLCNPCGTRRRNQRGSCRTSVTTPKVILEQKEEIKSEAAKNIVDAALIAWVNQCPSTQAPSNPNVYPAAELDRFCSARVTGIMETVFTRSVYCEIDFLKTLIVSVYTQGVGHDATGGGAAIRLTISWASVGSTGGE